MPCFHPVEAWIDPDKKTDRGKRLLRFSYNARYGSLEPHLKLSCGRCHGCRLDRSRQWAARCLHEAQMHEDNCFITLTFSQDALSQREKPWSLDHTDFQKFIRALRQKTGKKIRYYMAGEYGTVCNTCLLNPVNCLCGGLSNGTRLGRPHYHACLFGYDPSDKTLFKTKNGFRLYISDELSSVWVHPQSRQPLGYVSVAELNFETAAYVARYVMKKITGEMADEHYVDPSGNPIMPEYNRCSLKPGIAGDWFEKFKDDVHDGFIVVNGRQCRPPRYYDKLLDRVDPLLLEEIQNDRLIYADNHAYDSEPARLAVREQVSLARTANLKRNL